MGIPRNRTKLAWLVWVVSGLDSPFCTLLIITTNGSKQDLAKATALIVVGRERIQVVSICILERRPQLMRRHLSDWDSPFQEESRGKVIDKSSLQLNEMGKDATEPRVNFNGVAGVSKQANKGSVSVLWWVSHLGVHDLQRGKMLEGMPRRFRCTVSSEL